MVNQRNIEGKPFGQEGPTVVIITEEFSDKESSLSHWQKKILKAIPTSRAGISVRALAEKTKMLGDYGSFVRLIDDLTDSGHITVDENQQVSLTKKGKTALS